ncbi:MAG: mechanosensitive ion channel family protein [Sciscionella sp.]
MPKNLLSGTPQCVSAAQSWCAQVWHATHVTWLANSADWLIAKPAHILLIVVVAVVLRLLGKRLIDRVLRPRYPSAKLLRPLHDRVPEVLSETAVQRRKQRAETIASICKSVLSFVVFGLAFVLILGQLGVNLAPILASAGVLGVALGFGAQNLVRDFISGMFMMAEDQYGVGDVIDVGAAGGTVEAVGLRVTTLRDANGTVWYVRNGEIVRVGNSSQEYATALVDIPVGYEADMERVQQIFRTALDEAATEAELAADLLGSPTVLGVEQVSGEAVHVRAAVKVKPGTQWAVQRTLRARLVTALHEAGVAAPLRIYSGGRAGA